MMLRQMPAPHVYSRRHGKTNMTAANLNLLNSINGKHKTDNTNGSLLAGTQKKR